MATDRHRTREERLRLFRQLDRRDWQLWTLTLVVVIFLGGFIGAVFLWKWQGTTVKIWNDWVQTVFLLGFAGLTMLFCAYVLFQQAALKQVRRELIQDEVRAKALNREVTDLEKMIANVARDREREKVKSEFVSAVSHQLRTPLTNIRNSIDLVVQGKTASLTEEQTRFLDVAGRDVDRLTQLIDQLLDLSKIESGRAQFRFTSLDLSELVYQTVDGFASTARKKKIELSVDLSDGVPRVRGDRDRIQQVLDDLLANSLRVTPEEGRVTARVRLVPKEDRDLIAERSRFHLSTREDYVEISVDDTGVGLSEEDLRLVFDKFMQVGTLADGTTTGHGLGLAVARDIVRAHEGAIWAESEPGRGATFRFVLPTQGSSLQRLESVRRIGEAIEEARKLRGPFSLVVLRIMDPDSAGEDQAAQGEAPIDLLAELAQGMIRGSDSLAVHSTLREVHLLLSGTGEQGGRIVSERFRRLLENYGETHQGSLSENQIGIGFASFPDNAMTAVEIEELAREEAGKLAIALAGGPSVKG